LLEPSSSAGSPAISYNPLVFSPFPTMGTDYYKLLNVDKTATDDEIKKAYKKMVRLTSTSQDTITLIHPSRP